MRRFVFDLQVVLDYRITLEKEAEDHYMQAQARRLQVEEHIEFLEKKKNEEVKKRIVSLDQRRMLESYLTQVENEKEMQKSVLTVLADEESKAFQALVERRRDTKAMQKLHDKKKSLWNKEIESLEQKLIDQAALRTKEAA
jgi:flagellar export protein FliJ